MSHMSMIMFRYFSYMINYLRLPWIVLSLELGEMNAKNLEVLSLGNIYPSG